ncbi:MAG: Gfo/Idh/MocA family protein [Rhodospirillaceae bacterium]
MLRAAIVGLGSWGRELVESARGSLLMRYTAGCTRTPEKVEGYCREHGIAVAASFDAVLDDPHIDAVVLATPNSQHAAQVIRAAQAGKHVFVEKPFALNRDSARQAVAAAKKAGIVVGVGFNRRFHPSVRELRRRVVQGDLGAVGSIINELTATGGLYRAPGSWRHDPSEEPAGAMAAIGMHLVDTMVYLAGRASEVHCIATHRAVPQGDDTTALMLRFESGVTGLAYCSIAAARNYRLAVYGSRGLAEILRPTMDVFQLIPAVQGRASHLAAIPQPQRIEMPFVNSVTAELEEFARCVAERRQPLPFDDILHGVAIFEAAVESTRTRRPVAVANDGS